MRRVLLEQPEFLLGQPLHRLRRVPEPLPELRGCAVHLQVFQVVLLLGGKRLFQQKIQLAGCHVNFKLFVPAVPVLLGKPPTQTRRETPWFNRW